MAEDNLHDVELIRRAFQQARITNPLKVVHDGKEALDCLFCEGRFVRRRIDDRPSLILLDLDLPRVTGLEVLRRVKMDRRMCMIPVVVLTNSTSFSELAECRRLGVKAYIAKPASVEGCVGAVHESGMYCLLLDQPPSL
jgi:two-component system response regulator